MATEYTIYLVNMSVNNQTFWCFLQQPEELKSNPKVFANSSANLTVRPNDPGLNSFTIPVQYKVGAGASNQAVGLNVKINTRQSSDADLKDTWLAEYVTVPPKMGPTLQRINQTATENTIVMKSNEFDQAINQSESWYENMSFGIETDSGFIGMTWSPNPGKTTTLTPKLTFYIATGDYGSNSLADFTTISTTSGVVSVPNDFSRQREVTVVYGSNGVWSSYKGKPPQLGFLNELIEAHLNLSRSHVDLTSMLTRQFNLSMGGSTEATLQQDTITSVTWNSGEVICSDVGLITLSGSLTVTVALAAAFTYFVLSGVNFNIVGSSQGETSFNFTYDGALSAQYVKDLFVTGANIVLHKN